MHTLVKCNKNLKYLFRLTSGNVKQMQNMKISLLTQINP